MKVLQVNLQHKKAASSAFVKNFLSKNVSVALIQEPWVSKGRIRGLSIPGCEIFYDKTAERPRTCIVLRKDLQALAASEYCNADSTSVRLKLEGNSNTRGIMFASVYMPGEEKNPPNKRVEDMIRDCRGSGQQVIIGCDANAHHTAWGNKDVNDRGESILDFILDNNLELLNEGVEPTFSARGAATIIDLTLSSEGVSKRIRGWHVSNEPSLSDHRYIIFSVDNPVGRLFTFRNPRATNWGLYKEDLDGSLRDAGGADE